MKELSVDEVNKVAAAGFFHDVGKLMGKATAYFLVTRNYKKDPMRPEEYNSVTMG